MCCYSCVKMNFKLSTKFYINCFYYLGLSPICLNAHYNYCTSPIIFIVIQAFICNIIGLISLYLLNGDSVLWHRTNTETILYTIFVLCDLVRTAAIFIQSLLYKEQMAEILQSFQNLESYFDRDLQHSIDYEKFIKNYRIKVINIIAVCLVYMISFYIRLIVGDPISYAQIIFKILQVMTVICIRSFSLI